MTKGFPMTFTLDSGTHVVVTKTDDGAYDFALKSAHGDMHHFIYKPDARSKAEIEEGLDFDELNALRAFWLRNEEVV